MPKKPAPIFESLLDLLDEMENGPSACPHLVTMKNGGWEHEADPASPYFLEWVHGTPGCRKSASPGAWQDKLHAVGWDPQLQKDVPL